MPVSRPDVARPRPQELPRRALLEHVRDVADATPDGEDEPGATRRQSQSTRERDQTVIQRGLLSTRELQRLTQDGQRAHARLPGVERLGESDQGRRPGIPFGVERVTEAGDLIFRSCFKDSFQGSIVAQFAIETLGAQKAAILYDMNNDYSTGLTKAFQDTFESLGGRMVAIESYAGGDKDFNAQITKIKAAAPDVLFIPDYYNTISLVIKQVRNQGLNVTMLGADGWDELTGQAGDEAIGSYFSNHYSPDADDPDVQEFVRKYRSRYNVTPNALAVLGYDATYILREALARAGTTDPQTVKVALMQTERKLVTGHIKFDEQRNPVKSVTMLKIVKGPDGKLTTEYVGQVNP